MSKRRILLAIAALVSGVFALSIGVVSAQSFKTGTNVALQQNEKVNETLYIAAQNVEIASEVNGDVFCVGQTVTVSGTVRGDVICAGQTVTISGQVYGDVRLAGQTVTIESAIKGNASIGGQTFTLSTKGSIEGDASVGSSVSNINGPIGRDLAIGSESIVVNSSIGRNIQAETNTLELASNANVAGDITYKSTNKIETKKGARIGGEVMQTVPENKETSKNGALFGFTIGWFMYVLIALSIVSLLLALIFPAMLKKITDEAYPSPWKALLIGAAVTVVTPVLLILIGVTVVGIPLAVLMAVSWMLLLMLSGPLTGFYIGRRVMRNTTNIPKIMFVGGSILLISYFIPIVGVAALLLAAWLGIGMQLLAIRSLAPRPSYDLESKPKTKKK